MIQHHKMPKGNKKAGAVPAEEKKEVRLRTCIIVKARHILCEKLSKLQESYDHLYAAHRAGL